jgi:hypothetical protein
MKAFSTPATIARSAAIGQLSEIRYPGSMKTISIPTMWRWCKLVGIESGLRCFTEQQCFRLAQVANWLRQGYSVDEIKLFLGVQTNDTGYRTQQQAKPSSAPASNFDFDSFFGGASGG